MVCYWKDQLEALRWYSDYLFFKSPLYVLIRKCLPDDRFQVVWVVLDLAQYVSSFTRKIIIASLFLNGVMDHLAHAIVDRFHVLLLQPRYSV